MSQALLDAVKELAIARGSLMEAKASIELAQAKFEADHALLFKAANAAADFVKAAEGTVRSLADIEYALTRQPKLCPGVEVKTFTRLVYSDEDALAWARDKKLGVIPESLNRPLFERMAKAASLEFVQVVHEPRVQISSDLFKAFEAAGMVKDEQEAA